MRTNRDAIRIVEALSQRSNQLPILGWSLITDRVRNVYDRGAGIDDRIEYRAQVIDFSPPGIFRRKLHFVAKLSSALDSIDRNVESFASRLIEFVFQVNVTGSKKGVDARSSGVFERLPAAIDIGGQRTGKAGYGNRSNLGRDKFHRLEISFGRDGKAGLNNVDLKPLELARHLQFLFYIHAETGSLLSIS
jgi:hypothetical protein